MTRAGSPLRTRAPKCSLRSRANTIGGGPGIDWVKWLADHVWLSAEYQGNGPWYDTKSAAILEKGAAGQAGITRAGLYLPGGSADNYASTTKSAGDLDSSATVIVHLTPDEWNSGAVQFLIGDRAGGDSELTMRLANDGDLNGLWWESATARQQTSTASTATVFTDGQPGWVAMERDDNGGGNTLLRFYTSADGVSWSQLGTTIDMAATMLPADNIANDMRVGTSPPTLGFKGTIHSAKVYTGLEITGTGVLVMDPPFDAQTPGTLAFTDGAGNDWTVNQSADGSDDPEWKTETGTIYTSFPGVSGNYVSTPDSAALDITGDVELQADIEDWVVGSAQILIGKYAGGTTTSSYAMFLHASGFIQFGAYANGAWRFVTSAVTLHSQVAEGVRVRVRAQVDVDNGASGHDATFAYSTDGGDSWTDLGATITAATALTLVSSSTHLEIGSRTSGTADLFTGTVHSAQVYNGIDGTLAADYNINRDFVAGNHSTITSSTTTEVWTHNRGTTGRQLAIVTSPVWLPDGGDFWEDTAGALVPTWNKTTGKATYIIAGRWHDDNTSYGRLFSTESANNVGFWISTDQASPGILRWRYGTGTATAGSVAPNAWVEGALEVYAVVIDEGTLYGYRQAEGLDGGTSLAAAVDPTHAAAPRIAAKAWDALNILEPMEFFDFLVIDDEALTEAQLDAIAAQIVARHP